MIKVRIPATTANLGPGFDCLGLALNLWNTFSLELTDQPGSIQVETKGEGAGVLPNDDSHLVARTMVSETWPGLMPKDRGLRITCENQVPCASGLGSSSTAVLAGLVFASALSARAVQPDRPEAVLHMVNNPQNLDRVLQRAIQLEGHGDNVAPALLGGLVLVVADENTNIVRRVDFAPLKAVVCVPSFKFLTVEARAALPSQFSKSDTIHNVGHALAVVEALRIGDLKLLRESMGDRIHEPYRMPLIPGAQDAKNRALAAGAITTCLSGAGPGMLAFADANHDAIGESMCDAFAAAGLKARHWVLDAVSCGAEISSC
jgi:homoserine kinase